jgi:1-hydroxycarotenoid 3,4-desaturase
MNLKRKPERTAERVIVVGAGIGGLVSALLLAARGLDVTVVEKAATPGGKLREIVIDHARIDAGPTVFTMRWVFEEIFAEVGATLGSQLKLERAETLARHAWSADERLDLYADLERSVDAIGRFAGPREAQGYRKFCARARNVYETLEAPFIRSACAGPQALIGSAGLRGLGDLWRIAPFSSMTRALGEYFRDPRLLQLFGRYATYCGSSPYLAPATLMLVAHVEQDGVWLIDGGMHRLAVVLETLAKQKGARFRYGTSVAEIKAGRRGVEGVTLANGEMIEADAVIVNADPAALTSGLFGRSTAKAIPAQEIRDRSLSALTWAMLAKTDGFALLRHNVFFSDHYAAEFKDIFERGKLPQSPTVYVCAQDRSDHDHTGQSGPERLLCLVNAPPIGDAHSFNSMEIAQCEQQAFSLLERCGLRVERQPLQMSVSTPETFHQLFPGTGGAIYGQASHGWKASFRRPGSRTAIPGLYLAGGSTHPGPGVPMAALSGRLAAHALLADSTSIKPASTSPSARTATSGGTSTPSATTENTR